MCELRDWNLKAFFSPVTGLSNQAVFYSISTMPPAKVNSRLSVMWKVEPK